MQSVREPNAPRVSAATWFAATRPQFLLASLTCVLVGVTASAYSGHDLKLANLLLTIVGAESAHVAVHALNDYSDYKTGIDARVRRTPFSGGTGLLTSGRMRSGQMLWLGILATLVFVSVGAYLLASTGLALLPLGMLGLAVIWLYTSYLARKGLGELAVGLGFAMWCVGAYVAQTGGYSLHIVAVSALPGLAGATLLLLNEFPDIEADRWGGRRNLPITRGLKVASRVHALLVVSMFVWLSVLVTLRILPTYSCLAFVMLPAAGTA